MCVCVCRGGEGAIGYSRVFKPSARYEILCNRLNNGPSTGTLGIFSV